MFNQTSQIPKRELTIVFYYVPSLTIFSVLSPMNPSLSLENNLTRCPFQKISPSFQDKEVDVTEIFGQGEYLLSNSIPKRFTPGSIRRSSSRLLHNLYV